LSKVTWDDQPDLTDKEVAFLLALVWEVVHLDVRGPVHRLAREQGFSERDTIWLMRASGTRFTPDMYAEERMSHFGWPWPGQTPAEILDRLGHR
jgi:hypothetical protein